jgi:hypothetical protein
METVAVGPPLDQVIAHTLINITIEHLTDGMSRFTTCWAGPATDPAIIARVMREAANQIAPASPILLPK